MIYSVRCTRTVVDSHCKRGHRFRYEVSVCSCRLFMLSDLSGTERDPSARLSPTHLPLSLLFAGPIQSAESWLKGILKREEPEWKMHFINHRLRPKLWDSSPLLPQFALTMVNKRRILRQTAALINKKTLN